MKTHSSKSDNKNIQKYRLETLTYNINAYKI